MPHPRPQPPPTNIWPACHCSIYVGHVLHPACAFVYIHWPMATLPGYYRELSVPHRELSSPQCCGETTPINDFWLGVVLSTKGFPTWFSRMTSLPVRTPSAKVPHPRRRPPPTIIWHTRHWTVYMGHVLCPPCAFVYIQWLMAMPSGYINKFDIGYSELSSPRVTWSSNCWLDLPTWLADLTWWLELVTWLAKTPPAQVPHPRRRPPPTNIWPTRHCTLYIRGRPANRIARKSHAHTHTHTHTQTQLLLYDDDDDTCTCKSLQIIMWWADNYAWLL